MVIPGKIQVELFLLQFVLGIFILWPDYIQESNMQA